MLDSESMRGEASSKHKRLWRVPQVGRMAWPGRLLCGVLAPALVAACAGTSWPEDEAAWSPDASAASRADLERDWTRLPRERNTARDPGTSRHRGAAEDGASLPPLRPDPDPSEGEGNGIRVHRWQPQADAGQRRQPDERRATAQAPTERSSTRRRGPDPGLIAARDTEDSEGSPWSSEVERIRTRERDNAHNGDARPPQRAGAAQSDGYRGGSRLRLPDEGGGKGLVLGEGDVIAFNMFGQPDMATTTLVSPEGRVSLPLVGNVQVGGLTPSDAEGRITAAYREGGYFKDPQVNVTVEEYRSQQVSVLGAVNRPGRYPLKTQTTVLDALAQAEGVKPEGARTAILIRKREGEARRYRVDLDEMVSESGALESLTLQAGDVLYVPEAELFYIYGEVQRPDAYPLRPGMTVMQALSVGGGVTDKGSNSRIEIRRTGPDGEMQRIDPALTDRVREGDVIFVKERFF